jgi:ankyrin repeat protein
MVGQRMKSMSILLTLSLGLLALSLGSLQAEVRVAEEMFRKAVKDGDLNAIELLLSSGFNPNLPFHGCTPLYYAMQSNQIDVVRLLLARHADPNEAVCTVSRFSNTPLLFAIRTGSRQIASILIASGAHIDPKGATGPTALQTAVDNGRLEMIPFLIAKGADVNLRGSDGASPLDDAAWRGSIDAVAILLAHGARLDESNTQSGATPINAAAYRGHTATVEYLLRFRPGLGIADTRGHTPLDNAIRMGKEDSALLLLEAEPRERQTPQFFGRTMEAAIRRDESAIVESLLRHGAPANGLLPTGSTPLNAAASIDAVKTLGILLDNSADPNMAGASGATALEEAALRGFDSSVKMLLDHGALVNRLNKGSGTTALYAAAAFGKGGVVKLLLDRGAKPSLCGGNRKTPYQAALENGYVDVAGEIRSHNGAGGCQ